jgi:oligopeptide/dipeptide ABC transporter ATP-binding protein
LSDDALDPPVLECQNLTKQYHHASGRRPIARRQAEGVRPAVHDVSVSVARGECLGILGESGSGKTTLVRCLSMLERPSAGSVRLAGQEFSSLRGRDLRRIRHRVQVVFQDPYASLNPRQSIGGTLAEVLRVHKLAAAGAIPGRVSGLLDQVGIPPAWAGRYPSELSGGGRQRVSIARALAAQPDVLLADEAVSALDASVQAQVLNLLRDLRQQTGLAMIFVSHNVHVLQYLAQRTAVMFGGRVVEEAPSEPPPDWQHPYTRELLAAVPVIGQPLPRAGRAGGSARGEPGLAGCPYRDRCPLRLERCDHQDPELAAVARAHLVACHAVAAQAAKGLAS